MSGRRIAVGLVLGLAAVAAVSVLWAQTAPPKKGYILVQSDVTNAEQYAKYSKAAPDVVAKYGGRYLARGGRSTTLEGPTAPARVVVIEFPSFEAAQTFYHSPEYTAARKLRAGAATMQFVLVEAL
jgi:uncharacterized protein (DUF1330 family)